MITKAARSPQLFEDPECWSGLGLEPMTSRTALQSGALPTELTRRTLTFFTQPKCEQHVGGLSTKSQLLVYHKRVSTTTLQKVTDTLPAFH